MMSKKKTRGLDFSEYKEKYAPLWDAVHPITESDPQQKKRYLQLRDLCQRNLWLKVMGIPFQDDPCLELDSPYAFCEIQDLSILKLYFEHGNWAIRQGVVYGNLFFCNQVNGGDEWWTCRYDEDSHTWVPFESITFRGYIRDGGFEELITSMQKATVEQCRTLKYMERTA